MPAPETSASTPGHALVLTGLFAGYAEVPVVRELNLEVRPGEVVALLGPNGAGKTTTLETIAGLHRPISGTIELSGEKIGGTPAHLLARRGVALVPEGRALFPGLTDEAALQFLQQPAAPLVIAVCLLAVGGVVGALAFKMATRGFANYRADPARR